MQTLNWDNILQVFPNVNIHPMILENMVFTFAERHGRNYNGGQWHVASYNGSHFLVAPTGSYEVVNGDNYYDGTMNEKTFGAALTVLAVNRLLNSPDCTDVESLSDYWYEAHVNAPNYIDCDAVSDYYSFLD